MKTIILLLSAAALAAAADTAPLTGRWQIHSSVANNESDQDCTFTQKDADLSGTCVSDSGTVKIAGKVDGKRVSWAYKSEYNGTPLTVNFDGTMTADNKITGSVDVPEFSAGGDFTATLAK